MVWGSFLIAAAALKTPTRNGHNAQGVNLTFWTSIVSHCESIPLVGGEHWLRLRGGVLLAPEPVWVMIC